jgi:SAM-dependent methyltransferase
MSAAGSGSTRAVVSPWIRRWSRLVTPGVDVLDLACGGGRHSRWFASRGHPVTAVDRDVGISAWAECEALVTPQIADLEAGDWPLGRRTFGAVIVTNYLHRPLFPHIVAAVAPGGWLLYETFAAGNERFGRPSNPDFLLRPAELLEAVAGQLHVVAYEDRRVDRPTPALVQRVAAVRGRVPGW